MKVALFRQANQYSIRWQLLLSYAGIALLTAAALTGLLLFRLDKYYDQQERNYLQFAGQILSRQLGRMYEDNLSANEIQSGVDLFSFLAQARLQVLDENWQIVADSGPLGEQENINVNFPRLDSPRPADESQPYLSMRPGPNPPPPDDQDERYRYDLPLRRGAFGQILTDQRVSEKHSDQHITVTIRNFEGDALGYLKLSEGPALGREIVQDVAEKGIFAGAIAVLIAAVAGGIASRNISQPVLALAGVTRQMAAGNLAARIELKRGDEFGLLATAFNVMAERVETMVSTLRRFVEDAAHEINTPLTALRTNLELTAIDNIPETTRTDIEQSLAELARLENLTRSLLTLARLESPGMVLQHSSVDLTLLVREMHERYASRAEQAGITLSIDIPETPVFIQADQAQMTRVLDNLLDNALKFTPAEGQVVMGLHEDDTVCLWIQDTGIGIPEDDLSRLFSRFHRGRNAAAYPGNGLGLVITKAIVEEHGGHIEVKSQDGVTRFTVRLPVNRKAHNSDELSNSVS